MQHRIVLDALELGTAMTVPGTIADLDLRWHHDDWKADPLSWNRRSDGQPAREGQGGDTRTERNPAPQYQTEADRRAAQGIDTETHCLTCVGLDS